MPDREDQQTRDGRRHERDEPLKIDLDPELALRGLLKVDPDEPVPQDESDKKQGDPLKE